MMWDRFAHWKWAYPSLWAGIVLLAFVGCLTEIWPVAWAAVVACSAMIPIGFGIADARGQLFD